MEMENNLKGLKEEAKIYEREILSMLLEVSKSFTTDEMSKEKREEYFSKIDELREKLKSVAKVIEEVENTKYDCVYNEESILRNDENDVLNKSEIKEDNIVNEEFSLDDIECVEKEEINDSNLEEDVKEDINTKIDNNDTVENVDITEEDLKNIDKVIESMNIEDSGKEVEEETKEIQVNDKKEDVPIKNPMSAEDAIEKIDKLIKEAKELNKNVIKFPEQNVSRRNRIRSYETIEEIEQEDNQYMQNDAPINFDYNRNIEEDINYDIEPVPVLFGNRRAQNQMIIKKKSNGFSDKIKSLIFKIKSMLGGNNEEEN